MNKLVIAAIGFCFIVADVHGYETKSIFIKSSDKEGQDVLKNCTYHKLAGRSVAGGLNYTCVTLTKDEIDWIVQKLNNPAIINRFIDDALIASFTSQKNNLNNILARVLTDFKGMTVKKVLNSIRKKSLLRKLADVLPRFMGQEY